MTARMRRARRTCLVALLALVASIAAPLLATSAQAAVGTTALITGEIQQLDLNTASDIWSGGRIVVGGQSVVLPRNLLIDLPANRLTLQQIFAQAPAGCRSRNESGLAKADVCNNSGSGGFATIAANRTAGGNVIAGDVFIQKGVEVVSGVVTDINYTDGYLRLNGNPGDDTTGVMVRLNDPTGRHTDQRGKGCASDGGPNCSADPRFTEDADNYTQVFMTGYPVCLPSATARTFTDSLDFNGNGDTTEQLTAQSDPNGNGDLLCPDSNRPASNVAGDSRRMAPIQVGDHLTSKGNFETIDGTHFLSAYATKVSVALETGPAANQPDYLYLDSAFIDAPGFQNQRARGEFLGATTVKPSDVLLWSVYRDPKANQPHLLPLGSTAGCDAAGGVSTCTNQGIGPGGVRGGGEAGGAPVVPNNIFRIRYDVDFLLGAAGGAPAKPKLSPCAQIAAEPRFGFPNVCPGHRADGTSTLAEEFSILSPLPHEVQARTGKKEADLQRPGGPVLRTLDVHGNEATNGQYLFPLGIGLGGIDIPDFLEIDINRISTPFSFSGITWDLDRRLSPGGCAGPCEAAPQPLDPFPFEGMDPRTQALLPDGSYNDRTFTNSVLSSVRDRILSYVDPALETFDGDKTVLAWPPDSPPATPIAPTPGLDVRHANVTGLTPPSGAAGATVTIDGFGLAGSTAVSFGSTPATSFANVSDTQLTAVVPTGAANGPVVVTTPTGTIASASRFTVVTAPTVSGVVPGTAAPGDMVTVRGTGFATATSVDFNGTPATYTVVSDGVLRATVPTGATDGPVAVANLAGSAASATNFTLGEAPAAPQVTSVAPTSGPPGTVVTLTGSGFAKATSVGFGGVAAEFDSGSDTHLTATVPAGAKTGVVSVGNAGGLGSSPDLFTVEPAAPKIVDFAPFQGAPGAQITIVGSGFTGATSVHFGQTAALVVAATDSELKAIVPAGSETGPISVTTASGTAISTRWFTVNPIPPVPTISVIAPGLGVVGTPVTVKGTGFFGGGVVGDVTSVAFNGVPAPFSVTDNFDLETQVPPLATTGRITVTTSGGTGTSATVFQVITSPVGTAPQITAVEPSVGNSGSAIFVRGQNLTGTSAVEVNAKPVRSFVVLSDTLLKVVVGRGTRSGDVTVHRRGDIATSNGTFRIRGRAR